MNILPYRRKLKRHQYVKYSSSDTVSSNIWKTPRRKSMCHCGGKKDRGGTQKVKPTIMNIWKPSSSTCVHVVSLSQWFSKSQISYFYVHSANKQRGAASRFFSNKYDCLFAKSEQFPRGLPVNRLRRVYRRHSWEFSPLVSKLLAALIMRIH